jgi:hypothetical protein
MQKYYELKSLQLQTKTILHRKHLVLLEICMMIMFMMTCMWLQKQEEIKNEKVEE